MKKKYSGFECISIPISGGEILTQSVCTPNWSAFTLIEMGSMQVCAEGLDESGNWVGQYNNEPPD